MASNNRVRRKAQLDQHKQIVKSSRDNTHQHESDLAQQSDIAMLQNGQASPQSIMRLQRTVGNKATMQLMRKAKHPNAPAIKAATATMPGFIQKKWGLSRRNRWKLEQKGKKVKRTATDVKDTMATYGRYWQNAWKELVTGRTIKNTGIMFREWKKREDHYTAAAKHLAKGWKLEKDVNRIKKKTMMMGWQRDPRNLQAIAEYKNARTHYRRVSYLLKDEASEITVDIPWLVLSGKFISLPAVFAFATLPGKAKNLAKRYQKSQLAKKIVFQGHEHTAPTIKWGVDFFAIRQIANKYKENKKRMLRGKAKSREYGRR